MATVLELLQAPNASIAPHARNAMNLLIVIACSSPDGSTRALPYSTANGAASAKLRPTGGGGGGGIPPADGCGGRKPLPRCCAGSNPSAPRDPRQRWRPAPRKRIDSAALSPRNEIRSPSPARRIVHRDLSGSTGSKPVRRPRMSRGLAHRNRKVKNTHGVKPDERREDRESQPRSANNWRIGDKRRPWSADRAGDFPVAASGVIYALVPDEAGPPGDLRIPSSAPGAMCGKALEPWAGEGLALVLVMYRQRCARAAQGLPNRFWRALRRGVALMANYAFSKAPGCSAIPQQLFDSTLHASRRASRNPETPMKNERPG